MLVVRPVQPEHQKNLNAVLYEMIGYLVGLS